MVFFALAQGREQGTGLRHLQQIFARALGNQDVFVGLPAAALGHPFAKLHHIGPLGGGYLWAVFGIKEVFFVGHIGQPFAQECQGRFGPFGVAGAKLQVVHRAAELLQAAQRPAGQHRGQRGREQRLKQTELVAAGKSAQAAQRLVANAAFGRGHGAQKSRVVVVIGPQAQPGAQVAHLGAFKKTLPA